MRSGFLSEADGWTVDGAMINAPENLQTIRKILEDVGPIILEHWFYRGSRAPDRLVFDDYEKFEKYLSTQPRAGDMIYIWDYEKLCTLDNRLVFGKCPDDQGRVPKKGAY